MCEVIIIAGSDSDRPYASKIGEELEKFNIKWRMRIASAHKTPGKVLEITEEYSQTAKLFVTVAGLSNALSGMVDGAVPAPVIASPPVSKEFCGMDILSSLRMPSGVAPLTVVGSEQSALAAAKIIAGERKEIKKKIKRYREKNRKKIDTDDCSVK